MAEEAPAAAAAAADPVEGTQHEEKKEGKPPEPPPPPKPQGSEYIWKEGVPIPSLYFQPTLVDILVPIMAQNFYDYPDIGDVPPRVRAHIVELLPTDVPLELVGPVRWSFFTYL